MTEDPPPGKPSRRQQAASALAQDNHVLTQAIDALRAGDLERAQHIIDSAGSSRVTLGEAFRFYQSELETQALDHRESQQRVEASLDWFARVFRSLPVPAVLVDGRGMITDANSLALDELGLAVAGRTMQLPLRRLMADEQSEKRLIGLLPRADAVSVVGLEELRVCRISGEVRWVDLRVTQLLPRAGEIRAAPVYLCLFQDRTAQVEARQAQEARREAERERDRAVAVSQTKTELLSRLSHELRTPLNAVIGFTDLLLNGPQHLDGGVREKIDHIQTAGMQLLNLVNDVLDMNSAEAGQLKLTRSHVKLSSVAQEVIRGCEGMAQRAGVVLIFVGQIGMPEETAHALADASRVREVLQQLVHNAIQYNHTGGNVMVEIGLEEPWATVLVTDSGVGIAPEQMHRLFEPFHRLGTGARRTQGYGLGLARARSLARAMGGDLTAESQAQVGSRFRLKLPAVRASSALH
ncbi:MAG: hypothetical protein JNJ71_14630 [Rubrivivax sp.]|nr:hypothetical protein [Rubrivivax sp.]